VNFEEFAFQVPLYASKSFDGIELKAILYGVKSAKADGYCPQCRQASTFSSYTNSNWNLSKAGPNYDEVQAATGYSSVEIHRARESSHKMKFWVLLSQQSFVKVGQYPSLADVANDEAAIYRNVLAKEDAAELHKAIGLAAHGIGIGSFVYLRRVFERLINGRFDALREENKWELEQFKFLRMDEKIKFLKDNLPEFLVENSELYAIISKGIHELSEAECLSAFEYLQLSMKIILEEDRKNQEARQLREIASKAIKGFK